MKKTLNRSMMAADFIWIHLHFPRFARSTRQTPDHSRQLEPRVSLKEAVKMADASLIEIQRQYLQMNQLKGFTWKVGLLWLYLWCLFLSFYWDCINFFVQGIEHSNLGLETQRKILNMVSNIYIYQYFARKSKKKKKQILMDLSEINSRNLCRWW